MTEDKDDFDELINSDPYRKALAAMEKERKAFSEILERLAKAEQENEFLRQQLCVARDVLKELIECKDLKDRIDSNIETDGCIEELTFLEASYRRRKPLAWDAARRAAEKEKAK